MLEDLRALEESTYKCAEINFSNVEEPFSITCTYCGLITSCFEEFCKHFLDLHLLHTDLVELTKAETLEDDCNANEGLYENSVEILETEEIKREIQDQRGGCFVKTIFENERDDVECQFLKVKANETLDDLNNEYVERLFPSEDSDEYLVDVEFDVLHDEYKEKYDKKTASDELPNKENEATESTSSNYEVEFRLSSPDAKKLKSKGDFKCTYCEKTFSSKANCITHQFRHTEVRNFNCVVCTKAFYTHSELRTHMRYHTDERAYVCENCGKAFRHSWVLKKHCRTHTPQPRTLPCPKCNKLFAHRDNLRNHLETHNTATKFTCEFCGKKFTQGKLLWAHKKRSHLVKKDTNMKIVKSDVCSESGENVC